SAHVEIGVHRERRRHQAIIELSPHTQIRIIHVRQALNSRRLGASRNRHIHLRVMPSHNHLISSIRIQTAKQLILDRFRNVTELGTVVLPHARTLIQKPRLTRRGSSSIRALGAQLIVQPVQSERSIVSADKRPHRLVLEHENLIVERQHGSNLLPVVSANVDIVQRLPHLRLIRLIISPAPINAGRIPVRPLAMDVASENAGVSRNHAAGTHEPSVAPIQVMNVRACKRARLNIINNGQRRRLEAAVLSLPAARVFLILQIGVPIEAAVAERRNVNLRAESDSRDRPHTETVDSIIRTIPETMRRIRKIAAAPRIKKLLPQLTKRLIKQKPIGPVEMKHLLRVLRELTLSRVHARRQHKVGLTQASNSVVGYLTEPPPLRQRVVVIPLHVEKVGDGVSGDACLLKLRQPTLLPALNGKRLDLGAPLYPIASISNEPWHAY